MADEKGAPKDGANLRQKRRQDWWAKKRQHTRNNSNKDEKISRKAKKAKHEVEDNKSYQEKEQKNFRHILFIGNLSYDCGENELRNHFECCGTLKDARLLTKKATGKSKGCAFLEFENKSGQTKALNLHNTTLCGRKINVEITCGGGGKGTERMNKLKSKVDKMKEKRKKNKARKRIMKSNTSVDVE